jgi:ABC-type amino acid transport substrate-binding protein
VRIDHQQHGARQGGGLCHQPLLHRHAAAGEEGSGIKNYADLKGKTVAITTGTTNLQVLRKANAEKGWGMNIVMPKDHADGFLLVENDRAAFAHGRHPAVRPDRQRQERQGL